MNQQQNESEARALAHRAERSAAQGFLTAMLPPALRPFAGFFFGLLMLVGTGFTNSKAYLNSAIAIAVSGLAFGVGYSLFRWLKHRNR